MAKCKASKESKHRYELAGDYGQRIGDPQA